jgi:anti-sigma factor RsiW
MLERYLLGDLPDSERGCVEAWIFEDDQCFALICEIESDLIGRYIRGELPASESEHFEAHFLNSRRRRDAVAFARALFECSNTRSNSDP